MNKDSIKAWMDEHQVELVRTHATNLDGVGVAKYLNRTKFLKTLPEGHSIGDMALAMDLTGTPHITFWHDFRHGQVGDIHVRPDLTTLVTDGKNRQLAHCQADFTDVEGAAISLCPRTILRRITHQLADAGFKARAAFELEFFLFKNSFARARSSGYKHLQPIGASSGPNIYLARNAYHAAEFMQEVTHRLNAFGIDWESWSDEGGAGQVELNFPPQAPVEAADIIVRARQLIYEVAVDFDMSVTFMSNLGPGFSNGLHIHHSLQDMNDQSLFVDEHGRTPLLLQWVAGILKTMPAATSFLCPTPNACRRLKDFSAPPVTSSWGEENKSAGLRLITRTPAIARIEHRLASSDANPYLALAVILAGGLAGYLGKMTPPPELQIVGWGLPDEIERLPSSVIKATEALSADQHLGDIIGHDVIDYWINTRRHEWLSFHASGADPDAENPTPWEFERYFELI